MAGDEQDQKFFTLNAAERARHEQRLSWQLSAKPDKDVSLWLRDVDQNIREWQ